MTKLIRTARAFCATCASILALAALSLPALANESIALTSVGVNVLDIERAEQFYAEVFGMKRVFQYPPEGKPIEIGLARIGQPGATLILARLNDDPLPDEKSSYGRLIFTVSNADAIAARAKARGSTLRKIEMPGDNAPVIIFFDDPDGYEVELYQAPSSP
jgi:catechol 2,3-dioxygenase-like lactoylglutathione lyase family enzyme